MRASLLLLCAICACASNIEIKVRHRKGTDFTGYRTFAWLPVKATADKRIDQERLTATLKDAVQKELAARDITEVKKDPDFYVRYHAVLKTRRSEESINEGAGYSDFPFGDPAAEPTRYTVTYQVGSLILDIVDKDKKLVWRASAESAVDMRTAAIKRQRRVRQAVKKMLRQFPPGADK